MAAARPPDSSPAKHPLGFVHAIAAALLFAIFLVVLAQVFFRYVLGRPLVWTEEAARYLYVWTCYLGAAAAYHRGIHVRIGVVADRLPGGLRPTVELAGLACTGLFLAVFVAQAAHLAWLSRSTPAITLPIPWSAIYGAAVLSGALMLLFTVSSVRQALRKSTSPR